MGFLQSRSPGVGQGGRSDPGTEIGQGAKGRGFIEMSERGVELRAQSEAGREARGCG